MKNLCIGTQCGGFQFMLILDLLGIVKSIIHFLHVWHTRINQVATKLKVLLNLFKDLNYFHNSLPFLANLQKVSYLKLHIHVHTFVKSCCFLEALNVHSSKAETVQLRVQSSGFFCDGHKFPRLIFFWFALCQPWIQLDLLFIVCKCLVL